MQSSYRFILLVFAPLSFLLIQTGCNGDNISEDPDYRYSSPQYGLVKVKETTDSIHFPLDDRTYNQIKSFNTFTVGENKFLSLYDYRSQSVSIYEFPSARRVQKILLKDYFKNEKFYKTSVFTKNFDTILVNNYQTLYVLGPKGTIRNSIHFLEKPRFAWAIFENSNPAIFNDRHVFASVRPYVEETSYRSLQNWKIFYKFDLHNKKASLYGRYPRKLRENLYGRRFLEQSFCVNHKGNLVISFAGDTCLYETDLADLHLAYYAKSKWQTNPITPVAKQALLDDEGNKNYLLRDSYGPVYFDPHRKRYLRVAYSRISEEDFEVKNRKRIQRIIVFNEDFQIIGESEIDPGISLSSLFFSENGDFYARVRLRDEYAVHFVRLTYQEKQVRSTQLTRL